MRQNIITVIAEIKDGHRDQLEDLLRNEIDPGFDPKKKTGQCQSKMPFDSIRNLHFASFVILHEEHDIDIDTDPPPKDSDKLKPCLLFEATVDGEIDDFLETLVLVAGDGVDEIFDHCKDYPDSGSRLPHLVKQYLLDHDVGYNTFFSGHPGKSVAQIVEEDRLRQRLAAIQAFMRTKPGAAAQSYKGVQRQVRRYVRGGCRKGQRLSSGSGGNFRWAEETPTVPFEVRHGRTVATALGVAIVVAWAFALLRLSGYDWNELANCYRNIEASMRLCSEASTGARMSDWINAVATAPLRLFTLFFGTAWSLTVVMNLVAPLVIWIVARSIIFSLSHWERAGSWGLAWFLWGTVHYVFSGVRWMTIATLATVGALLLPKLQPSDFGVPFSLQPSFAVLLSRAVFIFLFICLVVGWLVLRMLRSMPEARPNSAHDSVPKRARRRFRIAWIKLGMFAAVYGMLLILRWSSPSFHAALGALDDLVTSVAGFFLALAAAVLIVAAILFFVAQVLLWWQFLVVEWLMDRGLYRYKSADVLTERPIGTGQFQREGNGINTFQNHLISISRIKGGPIRRFSLRLVLFIINQLCRWWYNRGDLGGIPNIHFLRWVIIHKGRRLLFVDSYSGSWHGYLDAFIDGGACKGMNAIWSHTFLKFESGWGNVSYPWTAFLMWQGARQVSRFKEIVRRSQPETLAWYSAYPPLDTENIHGTSEVRNALFQHLETHQLDKFIQRTI